MKLTEAQLNALSFPQGHHTDRALKALVAKGLLTTDRRARTEAGEALLSSLAHHEGDASPINPPEEA